MTIYEKESGFESLDDRLSEIKAYVIGAIGREELHEVELYLFRQMQRLGRGFLEAFIALSGTGYEAGNPPRSEEGHKVEYKGTEGSGSAYMSIFGETRIYRAGYAHPAGVRIYPIDAQLNLPAHKYSYLLLKWLQSSSTEQDFRSAVGRFNEIFDFSFFPDLPQRQGLPIAEYVEPFYEQVEAPPPQSEGSHIVISADCKGVRILKSEREETKEDMRLPNPVVAKEKSPASRKMRSSSQTSHSIHTHAMHKKSSKACSTSSRKKSKNRRNRIENAVEKKICLSLGNHTTSTSLRLSLAKNPPSTICLTTWQSEIPKAKNH